METAPARHRTAIVEDHPIFADGLRRCLDAEPDFDVVGVWASGRVGADDLAARGAELVLMDVGLPDESGIEATRRLRTALPGLRVVMVTAHADGDLLFAAMQAGAVGYVLKHTAPADLVATLRDVAAGAHALGPDLASRLLREFRDRRTITRRAALPALSPREEEVLKLLATGETNRQIAKRLFVCEETIKSHVSAILRKLEVSDRTRAAILAYKAGLVEA